MKNLSITFVLTFLAIVNAKQNLVNSIVNVHKTYSDLQSFCVGKSRDFCSDEHMALSIKFLQNQLDQIKKNIGKLEQEARKAESKRRRNRLMGDKMVQMLREHFLDRHI
jgi:hypothetical protein